MPADLTTLTTPTALGGGRFSAEIPDGWQQGRGAFGGLVLALLVRAGEAAAATGAGEARPLRSLTAEIPAPVLTGPVELAAEILRAGSGASTVAVRLTQGGQVAAHAVLVLGKARATDLAWEPPRPRLPPWTDVPVVAMGPPFAPTFARHIEMRPTGPAPFSEHGEARASGWVRPRDPGPARDAAYLVLLADAWWPALLARTAGPRPIATVAFTLQILGDLRGLDRDAPLHHEAEMPVLHEGHGVEQRLLRGADGRLLAMNQQTFTVIR